MRSIASGVFCAVLSISATSMVAAQDDETRQASGLPMKIGENVAAGGRMNVSGKVTIDTSAKLDRVPVVTVTAYQYGIPIEKAFANDSGIYLIRNVPRADVTVAVEVDGQEIRRTHTIAPPMGNPRIDFTVPWPQNRSNAKPGVVAADQFFSRTPENDALFDKAIAASKSSDWNNAIGYFNQLLSKEPKDFVAWTELGTVYFRRDELDNAEACYFKAIELKRDYFVALLNLGKLYMKRSQADNAVLVLSNAVAANAGSVDAQHFLGEAFLLAKKGNSAVFHLNEAIRLAPDEMADLHLRLAALYDAGKVKDKAAAEYKAYLAKRPTHPERAKLEKYIADHGKQ